MTIKLLIIDDDATITEMLELVLPTRGIEVYATNTSSDGVAAVKRVEPDIILLDLMMPDLDGWELCRQIRAFSSIPILVLSAFIETKGISRILAQGANDYLAKPAPLEMLIGRIQKLISSNGRVYEQ
jgi:two-component system response regulator MtrA